MIKKILFLLSFIAFLGTAQAQSFMIGPQLGYSVPSEEEVDGAFLFGAAARLKFGALGAEAAINYRQQTEEVLGADLKTKFYPVMISGLFYPLPIVYATAGIGYYNYKIELESAYGDFSETGSKVGYHLGGGVELPLGGMVLSGDIKYVFMKYQFEGTNSDYNADGFVINATLFFKLN